MKNYQLFKERKCIMENKNHLFSRLLPFLLTIVTAIIVVFIAQILLDVKAELLEVKATLRKMEEEKIKSASFQPFKAIQENCTDCHNERRFMGIHGGDTEINNIIKYMEQMPDVHLSPQDVEKVHGSLSLLKCAKCHDESQLQILASLNSARQREIIERMSKKSGSDISPDEVGQIQKAMLEIQGF
jgi:cell division protein FtsL